MGSARDEGEFKSPKGKLVTFFKKSRDQWKAKARESKAVIKRLKNRVVFLERSKGRLQSKVTELEQELSRLKTEARARAEELEELKKNPTDRPPKP